MAPPRRVLLTNDDGPPGPKSRYIKSFCRCLRASGFEVHACVPAANCSWMGKAMNPWQEVTVREEAILEDGPPWWFCEGATPASAANIGLHHGPGPFDLVLSGPNFGRNTSSCFALSSGTVAAATEGALAGVKAVAISFDNDGREISSGDAGAGNEDQVLAACWRTLDVIEALLDHWPPEVELFNVNVPLLAIGRPTPMVVPTCLETRVRYNSLYRRLDGEEGGGVEGAGRARYRFSVQDVTKRDCEGQQQPALPSDAETLDSGDVSLTPLKASLASAGEYDLSRLARSLNEGPDDTRRSCGSCASSRSGSNDTPGQRSILKESLRGPGSVATQTDHAGPVKALAALEWQRRWRAVSVMVPFFLGCGVGTLLTGLLL